MPKRKPPRGRPFTNRLWLARKRRGVEQKQAAYLLSHQSLDQISRFEQGARLPSLDNALKLEIIYGVPVRILFKELYDQLEDEIWERINRDLSLRKIYGHRVAQAEPIEGVEEHCAYMDLLEMPNHSEADRTKVHQHVTTLAKRLAYL